jgi:nucleoside-diphosphate-sugar epimerase
MRILVTGSTGFIGTHVITYLLDKGHDVIATSSDISKAKACEWFEKVQFKEYKIHGIAESNIDLFEFFDKPDVMLHLAWQGLPNYNEQYHVEENLFSQYSFLKNIIENGLKSISITGTCLEYGLIDGCLNETQQVFPSNFYAVAKDSLRRFIELLAIKHSVDNKWIRLFYMYGKGQNPNSLIPQLEEAEKLKIPTFKMSGGEQIRDYLPVEIVAKYLCKIALQDRINGIINCCSGRPITVRKFVEDYIKLRKMDIGLELGYYPYPNYEPFSFWGNTTKLKEIIAYGL